MVVDDRATLTVEDQPGCGTRREILASRSPKSKQTDGTHFR